MATAQWLQDNPKVLAYVSRDLYSKLRQFKKTHRIKSISEAINHILKSFFELEMSLPRSANDEDNSSQETSIKVRIAALEALVGQLVCSASATGSNLPIADKEPFIREDLEKSDLLLSDSKSLTSHVGNSSLSRLDPLIQNQSGNHLLQKRQEASPIILSARNEELSKEEIGKSVFFKSDLGSVDTNLSNSPKNDQVSDESIPLNPLVNSVSTIESNLPIANPEPLTEEDLKSSDLLSSDSKSLDLRSENLSLPQLNPLLKDQKQIHQLEKNQGNSLIVQISKNKELNRELIDKSVYSKCILGLMNKGLFESSDNIQTLAKSILANPSCVCFSIIKKPRMIKMTCFYRGYGFEYIEECFKLVNQKRKTAYYKTRDRLNEQLIDPGNPLDLDRHGKNINVPEARDLAVLVKQLREKDEIFQVYVIPLSMLSRMLVEAGFPMTSSNLLKVRLYVAGIFQEVLKSMYAELLKWIEHCGRNRYGW